MYVHISLSLSLSLSLRYAKTQQDDSPLYVFDADFGDEGKPTLPLLNEYEVRHTKKERLFNNDSIQLVQQLVQQLVKFT